MAVFKSYFWKKAPFVRLVLAMSAGIVMQWYLQFELLLIYACSGIALLLSFIFSLTSYFVRFKWQFINGISLVILFISLGGLLAWHKDIRHNKDWIGHLYTDDAMVCVTIDEPLVEKTKSRKANAVINYVQVGQQWKTVSGKIILYFQKDSILNKLEYGSQVVFKKPLQEIKNSGNPGGFDYKRYSLFNGITHQVYLKNNEFSTFTTQHTSFIPHLIFRSRDWVLSSLRNYIPGQKELGLAEALLIGYKDDLDQTLVQSYTNTGVVHVIAISGLHLGLIYWLLIRLFQPLHYRPATRWMRPFLILAGLWGFSLLAGAQPSVLRSAVMFTCLVLGDSLGKKTSIFNSLAFSAFILLCINPYWLWDVGFQLSYAAVLSIVVFMKPIYNWLYFKNKGIDFVWKLTAITLAAQILTLPVSIYHFHQFPTYFILTNFLAVPLSSVILIAEIFLCLLSFIPPVAVVLGKVIGWLIWLMNSYVERVESIPYSLFDGIQINMLQAVLLLTAASFTSYWLMEKSKTARQVSVICLSLFFLINASAMINARQQAKIIVYNVPQKPAIDLIEGTQSVFIGDTSLLHDGFARNFHLKPSRILHRTYPGTAHLPLHAPGFLFSNKHVLLIDQNYSLKQNTGTGFIDLLVISKRPRIDLGYLSNNFSIKQVVADGSVPSWQSKKWKMDCQAAGIPYHDVALSGAFVMNLR